jgi:alkanesulfonate monooxygenase SsuD/methylene tetrahydromethanopterin reductase-like flavin-dependent oxidoreductase (luciferase family)
VTEAGARLPVGVNLTAIGVSSGWWLESAERLEQAGFRGAWIWDHFLSRGVVTDPVLECWTTLAAAAARTTSMRVGSFVTNVMNRHPSLLARMAATVQDGSGGRLELGIGIGGHPEEHHRLGIPFPDAPERAERLEEAVTVLRLLWSGGPVSFEGRHYRLEDAVAHPVPAPPPRIVIGGEKPAGARLAARIGDAWTTNERGYARDRGTFREALAAAGRRAEDVPVLLEVRLARDVPLDRQPLVADLAGEVERWAAEGVSELIVANVRDAELPAVLAAAERAC